MKFAVTSTFLGSDSVGRVIDRRFTLLRWLGGSDQSSVFLTELPGDPPRNAAIKVLPDAGTASEARLAQWEAAKNLSHPHLMRLFHHGRSYVDNVDLLYVVTENAEEVLSEILRERPLTPEEIKEMLGPIVDTLSWLHERKLIHGHLKPSNIMVVDGQLKLSVDGLRTAGNSATPTPVSGPCDAPEVAAGNISPAADVWSLGLVLVEAFTQQPPAFDEQRGGEPIVPPSIPQPFYGLVWQCLQLDPARRTTLRHVKDWLGLARPAEPVAVSNGKPPKNRMPILAGAAAVVVVIVAALLIMSHHSRPSSAAVPLDSAPPPVAVQPQTPAPAPQPQPSAPRPKSQKVPAPQAQPQTPNPQPQPHSTSSANGAVADQAMPDISQSSRNSIQGHIPVSVRVDVDPSGHVSAATIESAGPSRYFAGRALKAAQDTKFRPAQVDGRAVASQWTLHFQFAQSGTTVTPTQTSP
ncbi:MAG TPA: TonB family protein [Acidobacteriaceae bacterium]|jgi:TonB family protein